MSRSKSVLPPRKFPMKKNSHPQKRSRCRASHSEAATAVAAGLWAAPVFPSLIAVCLSLFCATGTAQTPDTVAQREIQRRQTAIPAGEAALAQGRAAMKAKNYTLANQEFRTAVTYLPDAVVSGKAHDEAVEGFCKSGVILAEARIAEGRYADAEAILTESLSDRYDDKCHAATELYTHLGKPGEFNKTRRPTHFEKDEQVQ